MCEIDLPEDLLARARAGQTQAHAEIYRALAPATFGLIRRLVASRAVAEDLFQDTMMTVLEQLPAFRGECPFGGWVRRIAISKCLMYLRSPWQRARLQFDVAGDAEATPEHTAAPPAAEAIDLERALRSLSPTARAVVWLYEVEGYSHEEIAAAFGRSISFSKSQLARAHRRLRLWFDPQAQRQPCTPI